MLYFDPKVGAGARLTAALGLFIARRAVVQECDFYTSHKQEVSGSGALHMDANAHGAREERQSHCTTPQTRLTKCAATFVHTCTAAAHSPH